MVDVATVSSVTPSAQQAAAATPTTIDTVFGALLQQITDAAQSSNTQLGANIPASQTQTGFAANRPSIADTMALIQNPLGTTATSSASTSTVTGMPATPLLPDDTMAVQPDIAALLARISPQNNTEAADQADNVTSKADPILPGLMQSTAHSTASASTATVSASLSDAATSSPIPAVASDAATAIDNGIEPSNQATGDAQNTDLATLAALFMAPGTLSQQPSLDRIATNSANVVGNTSANQTALAGLSDQASGQTTAQSPAQQISTAATPPAQTSVDASEASLIGSDTASNPPATLASTAPSASAADTQARTTDLPRAAWGTPASQTSPSATQSAMSQPGTGAAASSSDGAEPALVQAASAQAARDAAMRDGLGTNDPSAAPSSEDSTRTTTTGMASQATQTPDQTAVQTVNAVPLAAPIPFAQAAPPTAAISQAAAVAAAGNQAAVAQTSGQANARTAPASGSNNKPDLKNKAAQASKTPTNAGQTSEGELANRANSQIGEEGTVAAKPVAANNAAPFQPEPVRTAMVHVDHDKPAIADAGNLQQATNPLAPIDPGKLTAKVEITTQHSDGDTTSTFDKLGLTIAARTAEGLHHFDIRLDPADLGRVQVRLTVDDNGQAQATLVADKQQTLDMLQRDSSNLNRALQDAGLNLSNNGLNFSLREQHQQNESGSQGRRRALSANTVLSAEASQSRSPPGSYAPNSVRLDIRV